MALDSNILAQTIEDRLNSLSMAAGKGPLPALGKADRDMLFSAIAQAVVNHLQSAAAVEVNDPAWPHPVNGVIE